jgi:hypothetical protein
MGGHRAGHTCARACRCNRAKQSYLLIEIFVDASLLPTPDRMGEALRLTIDLDPRPTMARPPPCFPVRKIVPSLSELPISQIALQQKDPTPACTENGSHLSGAHHSGRARQQKITVPTARVLSAAASMSKLLASSPHQATHTAREKPLARSTTTSSNFQSNTTAKPVSARVGRDRAAVKCV